MNWDQNNLVSDYKFSSLQPFDLAIISLIYVMDYQQFPDVEGTILALLEALNLGIDGLSTPEDVKQQYDEVWKVGFEELKRSESVDLDAFTRRSN